MSASTLVSATKDGRQQGPVRLKLEALDLLAHRGLGEMQPLGRATETTAFGDRDQGAEEVEVEHWD
jgi:hypothetical protein